MRTRAQQGGEWHVSDDLLVPDPCKEATKLLDAVVITPVVTVMAFNPSFGRSFYLASAKNDAKKIFSSTGPAADLRGRGNSTSHCGASEAAMALRFNP